MTAAAEPFPGPRLRIWEIDARMHCSIVGTCLTLGDLHTLTRRAGGRVDPSASPYQVHSWFVDFMSQPNVLSRLVDKELERRHRAIADKVRRAATEEEIGARWKEISAKGTIVAAYWGAMSHRRATPELRWRVFGDVHMLSHLVGASRGETLCRVHDLEVANAALEGKVATLKHDHRAALKERHRLEEELQRGRRESESTARLFVKARERIAALEAATGRQDAEVRIEELTRSSAETNARAAAAEITLHETQKRLAAALDAQSRDAHRLRELSAENEALEVELAKSVGDLGQSAEQQQTETESLVGLRILCVGGRTSLVQHYRALAERRGAAFVHHDGGLEDSLNAVTRTLRTVDVVFCPIDCVSHAACLKVKHACKHLAKRFVVLRSSGLSSFARALRALVEPDVAGGASACGGDDHGAHTVDDDAIGGVGEASLRDGDVDRPPLALAPAEHRRELDAVFQAAPLVERGGHGAFAISRTPARRCMVLRTRAKRA